MNKRNFLIKESLKKKIKSKWFLGINIFIFIMLILTLNINAIISLFGGDFEEEKTIYVIDEMNVYDQFEKSFNSNTGYNPTAYNLIKTDKSVDDLKDTAMSNPNISILVIKEDKENYLKGEIYVNKSISSLQNNLVFIALNKVKYDYAVEHSSISRDELVRINQGITINTNVLTKEENTNRDGPIKTDSQYDVMGAIVVVAFILPFFFLIVTLVQMIGAEINEEKTNKSMEIIISNVDSKDHLISKIVSCTSFMIFQVLLIVIYFSIASFIRKHVIVTTTGTGTFVKNALKDIITPEIIKSIITIIPLLIIFFIFTFITYAIIAGVLASITTSIDDFQQLQTPLMLIISLGFYLSIMSIIFEGSKFIIALSYVPLISFLLSPSLYMLNQISMVSLMISTFIQVIFSLIVYKYGLKIYKEGILNYSGTNLWRKMFRSIKTK